MSVFWDSQLSPFTSGIRSIGTALAQRPAIQAMAANRAAQAQLYGARTGQADAAAQEALARKGLLDAQTGEIATGDSRIDDAGNSTKAYMAAQQAYQDNPNPQTKAALEGATSDFAGAAAKFKNVKVGDLVTALGKTGALNNLVSGSPDFAMDAGLQGNAAQIADTQANNAAKAALPANNQVTLPTGSELVDRNTGGTIAQALQKMSPGQTLVGDNGAATMTQVAAGAPLPPKASATQTARTQLGSKLAILAATPNSGITTNDVPTIMKFFDATTAAPEAAPAAAPQPPVVPFNNNPSNPVAQPMAAQPAVAAAPAMPVVNTQQDYDALPAGASYVDSVGNKAVKQAAPAAK